MSEPDNRQILDEASAWFVEFRVSSPTARSREEFMQWLRRSPDHIRAYLEISRTYVQLPGEGVVPDDETARLLEKARARLEGEVIPLDIAASRQARLREPHAARLVRLPVALAACLVVAFIGAIVIWSMNQRGLYTTEAGEQRSVTLADGSRIELNGRTRLRVAYSDRERDVKLLEGQALFQVAKDKSRPFIVDSGSAQIRAVGTEFDVHRQGAETTVTVLEGRVAVLSAEQAIFRGANAASQQPPMNPFSKALPRNSSSGSSVSDPAVVHGDASASSQSRSAASDAALDPSGSAVTFLIAGEQVMVTPGGVSQSKPANVSAATAWTRGQLEFDETPLAQVAEQFNRSSPRPLVLDSQNAGTVRISGVYSSVDPASLILFLRSQPDLEVIEAEGQIKVRIKRP